MQALQPTNCPLLHSTTTHQCFHSFSAIVDEGQRLTQCRPSPVLPMAVVTMTLMALWLAGAIAEESAGTNSRQAGGGGSAPLPLPQQAGFRPEPLPLQGPVCRHHPRCCITFNCIMLDQIFAVLVDCDSLHVGPCLTSTGGLSFPACSVLPPGGVVTGLCNTCLCNKLNE